MTKCGRRCEVFSRVVGYFRPVSNWNKGKRQEFKERVTFDESCSLQSQLARANMPSLQREEKQATL